MHVHTYLHMHAHITPLVSYVAIVTNGSGNIRYKHTQCIAIATHTGIADLNNFNTLAIREASVPLIYKRKDSIATAI